MAKIKVLGLKDIASFSICQAIINAPHFLSCKVAHSWHQKAGSSGWFAASAIPA